MKVKGISQLRLNQDTMETRVKELRAGGLAHSAGNSWRSAQSGERCVLVRISVDESWTVTGRVDGPGAGRFDQIGLRLRTGSGQASRRMDLRQKYKEKAKEKEKEVAPGDRTPKDQKWTVVREKHHEDRGHGKMCGDWVDSENCEATGASGAVGQDGAEQTGVLPAGTIPTTVLPALVEQLRLNQDTMETRVKELSECLGSWTSVGLSSISSLGTAGGQLNPVNGAFWFGSVWTSPGRLLGEPMVRVQDGSTKLVLGLGQGVGKLPECELRLSDRFVKGRKGEKPPMGGYGTVMGRFWEEGIENTEKIQERKRDTNLGSADLIQEIILECSWCVWACDQEDDLRQKDKEKAKEKEKEVAPGDRTPKDQKLTVVREKHHEDRGHGKMPRSGWIGESRIGSYRSKRQAIEEQLRSVTAFISNLYPEQFSATQTQPDSSTQSPDDRYAEWREESTGLSQPRNGPTLGRGFRGLGTISDNVLRMPRSNTLFGIGNPELHSIRDMVERSHDRKKLSRRNYHPKILGDRISERDSKNKDIIFLGRCVTAAHTRCPVATLQPSLSRCRSLRSDRTSDPIGRYIATKLEPKLGRYVATEQSFLSVATNRARPSSRSDRVLIPLGRYIATVLEPKLGRYVATERSSRIATELEPKLSRYVATEFEPKLGRYIATGLEPKFGRCIAIELFRTSIQHQSMHSRQTFKCNLPKTVASSVHAFRYSKSSIRLCELKTAESLFFIERTRSKCVKSEDGPKGPKTRLEAHPTIS
ncbi:hypothetical protein IGI04_025992 [Brassica rapa subsp. trilocularis]|uniref:Uncharacterized protein n=1 Tax=Brassica rapa subsp. trilocularis TaxID=1813537 RepID=A0ABQ7KUP7_BRACM|nr:hypothetical protein IGI04_025992 [Brassica rapa subsp. trilocularis]